MSGSESEKIIRKDEGSLKLTGSRPVRSREGSGILRLDINKPRLSSGDLQPVSTLNIDTINLN